MGRCGLEAEADSGVRCSRTRHLERRAHRTSASRVPVSCVASARICACGSADGGCTRVVTSGRPSSGCWPDATQSRVLVSAISRDRVRRARCGRLSSALRRRLVFVPSFPTDVSNALRRGLVFVSLPTDVFETRRRLVFVSSFSADVSSALGLVCRDVEVDVSSGRWFDARQRLALVSSRPLGLVLVWSAVVRRGRRSGPGRPNRRDV